MPSFQNPYAFLCLLLIPLFLILRKLKLFSKITFPAVLGNWNGRIFTPKNKSRKYVSAFCRILKILSFLLIIIAYADPVVTRQEKIYTSLGTDIMFILDTSPSMAAYDIEDNQRLETAKNTVKFLATNHDGARYGLVVLGSNTSVLVPPTSNHNIFFKKLEEIQPGMIGDGSAIGDGISTAVCHLVSSSAPKKCIILLTDGENNGGQVHPQTAANLSNANKITIYVVGIGTRGTVPIHYVDPATGKVSSGTIISNFNAGPLKQIASVTGGKYFEVTTAEELNTTLEKVIKTESVAQNFTYKTVSELYYDRFLFAGMLVFILAWIIKRLFLGELI